MLSADRAPTWECVLTRNRMLSNRSEGINLAWSPDGRLLACTTGTSTIWLIDAAAARSSGSSTATH